MLNAQVGIERSDVRGDGIMDFPESATKGILLPRILDRTSVPVVPGAMAFNLTSQQIEIYHPDSGWESMAEPSVVLVEPLSAYSELSPENGVIISAGNFSTTPPVGVLVLESDDKALILPQVPDVTLLPSPEAGMIAYDMSMQSMAIFNGSVWNFWN